MFTFNVDLGQLIIASLIGIVGFFVKRTIDKLESRLDRNESAVFDLSGAVQRLIGAISLEDTPNSFRGIERRSSRDRNR